MAKSDGLMNIVMIVVVIGGFLVLWPHLQGALGAAAAPVQTGDGKAKAVTAGDGNGGINGMMSADEIREKTRQMIAEITAKARRGSRGTRQRNSGGGGTNISVQGHGATAWANGRCVSGLSNVI